MKVTGIISYQSQKVWTLQVDFGEVDRHHQIRLQPNEDHIDLANRLHQMAEAIKHDPHLQSNKQHEGC